MTKFNSRPPPPTMAPQPNSNNHQNSTFVEKLMIGLDHAPPAFNLREQVIGAGGANLNYIRNETGAIATLRGRGSMFVDPVLGVESPEPLHLYIEHPRFDGLQAAKQLAKNLIETLQQELVHFTQISQNSQNVPFSTATTGGTIIQQTHSVPQINVPPPSLLAVPPPMIQQNTIDPQTNQTAAVVQQNFIQQNPPPSLGGPPQTVQSQPQTIIHQQIIPQTVPIQLQQGNMVIQQPVQQPSTITNVNIPPPGIPIPIKTGQIVQFQQPPPHPPPGTHLTQPPPNVQLQSSQQAAATQIVLNHPQNYQYQYIQQPVQAGDTQIQPNQVTIQHIYQPQQQIQGLVQQAPQQTQTFDQFQHVRPQQFQAAPPQQYITVQGSTAYMVPPPTIIQQQSTSQAPQQTVQTIATSNSNIIFQPPPQIQQVQMQVQPTAITVQSIPQQLSTVSVSQEQTNQVNGSDENRTSPSLKEEIKSESDNGDNSSEQKNAEIKLENDSHSSISGEGNNESTSQSTTSNIATITMTVPPPTLQNITIRPPPPPPQQQQVATNITLHGTQIPPPIMAVPPPVQHFVGNTLITHPQAQTHTNQIYNQVQVPVSIQQIQSTGQQIHVSTPTGQHFLVNTTPQWPTSQQPNNPTQQIQQIQSNGTIQNVQITHQIAANQSEFRALPTSGQHQSATQQVMTFNPHVQVQLQPQMIQQVSSSQHIEHAQLIGGQITVPPPTQQFNLVQTQAQNIQMSQGQTFMTSFPQQQHQQQHQQHQQQQQPQQQLQQIKPPPITFNEYEKPPNRIGQKRKYDEDDGGPPNHQPRVGMGDPLNRHQQQQQQSLSSSSSSSVNSNNNGNNSSNGTSTNNNCTNNGTNGSDENNLQKSQNDGQQQQQQQSQLQLGPPPSQQNPQFYQDRFFHRGGCGNDMNDGYIGDGNSRQSSFDCPPNSGNLGGINNNGPTHGPRSGPRFHHMMSGGNSMGYSNLRNQHHGMMQDGINNNYPPMHRMNFGPPPPPPPYRGEGPPNLSGGYGPPPPSRFRGQW